MDRKEFEGNIVVTISKNEVRLWICNHQGQNIFRFKAMGKVFKTNQDVMIMTTSGQEEFKRLLDASRQALKAIDFENRTVTFGAWRVLKNAVEYYDQFTELLD